MRKYANFVYPQVILYTLTPSTINNSKVSLWQGVGWGSQKNLFLSDLDIYSCWTGCRYVVMNVIATSAGHLVFYDYKKS